MNRGEDLDKLLQTLFGPHFPWRPAQVEALTRQIVDLLRALPHAELCARLETLFLLQTPTSLLLVAEAADEEQSRILLERHLPLCNTSRCDARSLWYYLDWGVSRLGAAKFAEILESVCVKHPKVWQDSEFHLRPLLSAECRADLRDRLTGSRISPRFTRAEKVMKSYGTYERLKPGVFAGSKFDFITRYVCGDETELLKKLSMLPEQCRTVDLLWLYQNEVYFVEINSFLDGEPGAKLRKYGDDTNWYCNIHIHAGNYPLLSSCIERSLRYITAWINEHKPAISVQKSSDCWLHVADVDICAQNYDV